MSTMNPTPNDILAALVRELITTLGLHLATPGTAGYTVTATPEGVLVDYACPEHYGDEEFRATSRSLGLALLRALLARQRFILGAGRNERIHVQGRKARPEQGSSSSSEE